MQMNDIYPIKRRVSGIFLIGLVSISILVSSQPLNLFKSSIKVIVIDAGHGGLDYGCHGSVENQEKNIALDIALKLGDKIKKELPDVKVIYTRTDDRLVELWKRADIANRNKADLFISIHCNAHTNKSLSGAETYVMGLHKNAENIRVSQRENKSLKLEENYEETGHYSDFDPSSAEAHIILSLYQNAFLEHSISLASIVQDNVKNKGKMIDLGVNQAGFLVLWKTTMPSILIETGYLTNPANEAYLISEVGKNESASNIFEAIKEFKIRLEASK